MMETRDQGQCGITLVEVLVTLVILAVGLLGLVALQARVQILQAEAYQRAQALLLLKDMAGRIANNRNNAAGYAIPVDAPLGVNADMTCPAPGATRQSVDLSEWCQALQGAAETLGTSSVGAMAGGRGCVENLGNGRFLITVAWQGLAPISEPPDTVACAAGLYDGAEGSACAEAPDRCRRVVTTIVRIPVLT